MCVTGLKPPCSDARTWRLVLKTSWNPHVLTLESTIQSICRLVLWNVPRLGICDMLRTRSRTRRLVVLKVRVLIMEPTCSDSVSQTVDISFNILFSIGTLVF